MLGFPAAVTAEPPETPGNSPESTETGENAPLQHAPEIQRSAVPRRRVPAFLVVLLLSFAAVAPPAAAGGAATELPPQAERVKVGDDAPDFALESLDGETYRLSDLEGDKRVILIFFRGAW